MSNPPEKENIVKDNQFNDILKINKINSNKKKNKHVTFSKPAYTIIEVESYMGLKRKSQLRVCVKSIVSYFI